MSRRLVTVLRVDEDLARKIDGVREELMQKQGVVITRTAVAAAALRLGLPLVTKKKGGAK